MRVLKRVLLLIGGVLLAAIITLVAAGLVIAYNVELDQYTERGPLYPADNAEEIEQLRADGYEIKYPFFEGLTPFNLNWERDVKIYTMLTDASQCYANDVATTFEHRAKLDYTVTHSKTDNTLTISFTGEGYPSEGEPRCLDRVFVYDVKDINSGRVPVLISDSPADPDAVEEFWLRVMRGELVYDELKNEFVEVQP